MRWSTYKRALIHKIGTKKQETPHGISYEIFTNIPELARLSPDDTYSRVWIVDQPRTTKVKAVAIREDGIEVKFAGEIPIRTYYPDEVLLHPSEWEDNRQKNKNKSK